MWAKIRGGALVTLGFMLSPLSWWNDLIFNLPIAYGFGWLFGLFSPGWVLPMTVVGYWISNLLGILMMQWGTTDVLKKDVLKRDVLKKPSSPSPDHAPEDPPRDWQREIWIGVASSTAYTLLIVGLVQFHIVDVASIFPMLG
ncbi:MAG: hypothetical protein HC924_03665 [Synechococcaceae cyanobacterium SM2_3_2]|nr:hypothetical protein [Synechococcaceae cyanobacterium SM2_3_2]